MGFGDQGLGYGDQVSGFNGGEPFHLDHALGAFHACLSGSGDLGFWIQERDSQRGRGGHVRGVLLVALPHVAVVCLCNLCVDGHLLWAPNVLSCGG